MSVAIESSIPTSTSTSSPEQDKVFLAKYQSIDPVLTAVPSFGSMVNIPKGCIETQTNFFLPGEDGKGGTCGVYIGETKENCQLYVYDAMTNFIQQCTQKVTFSNELKFSIGLLPFGHYNPKDAIYGVRSGIGCVSDQFASKLPPVPEKYELLNIHFETKSKLIFDHGSRIKNLPITPGPRGNRYEHYITKFVPKWAKCGKYKKEGFDELHASLQKVFGEMKEIDVLNYITEKYHSKLFSLVPYTGEKDCIETLELNCGDNSCVVLSFTTEDLTKNTDALIDILSTLLD